MSIAAALVSIAVGLLVWPVPSRAERRLGRLGRAERIGRAAASSVGSTHVSGRAGGRDRSVVGMAVAVAAGVAGLAAGFAVGFAAGAAVAAVGMVVCAARRARAEARCRRDLLTALTVLRGELDAGTPFPTAVRAARERAGSAQAAFDLGTAAGAGAGAGVGGDDDDGDGGPRRARRDATADARRALTAGSALVAVTGAPWSAVAAGITRDVAALDARDREVDAALAGARASTVVLGGLPVLGLGLAATLGADPTGFLLHTPAGTWVLAAGVALDLLGVLASGAVANRAAR